MKAIVNGELVDVVTPRGVVVDPARIVGEITDDGRFLIKAKKKSIASVRPNVGVDNSEEEYS